MSLLNTFTFIHRIWTFWFGLINVYARQHLIYSITPDSGPTQVKTTSHFFTDINCNWSHERVKKKIIGIGIQHLSLRPKHFRDGLEHSNTSTGQDPASAFFIPVTDWLTVSPESAFWHQDQSGTAGTESSGNVRLYGFHGLNWIVRGLAEVKISVCRRMSVFRYSLNIFFVC